MYVTYVNDPRDFYCQFTNTASQFDDIMNNMETYYRDLNEDQERFTNPKIGDTCCAQFTADDGFYRAVITNVLSDAVVVRYVDYGNTEELPFSRLKCLDSPFVDLPEQAFNAIMLSSNCGSAPDFENCVVDRELKATIVKQDDIGRYCVQLADANGKLLFEDQSKEGRQNLNACLPLMYKDVYMFMEDCHAVTLMLKTIVLFNYVSFVR